jgi:hypothetical protein
LWQIAQSPLFYSISGLVGYNDGIFVSPEIVNL